MWSFSRRDIADTSRHARTDTRLFLSHLPPPGYSCMAEQGAHASNDWTEQRVEASGSIGTCAGHTSEAAVRISRAWGGVEPRAEPDIEFEV